MKRRRSIAFTRIASAAAYRADDIMRSWLPDGRREGREWVAKNPRRADSRPGSFKVNLSTGKWGDFATNDRGGDLISLAAFLFDKKQDEAAVGVAEMLGLDAYE
ncbi:hypothetical protein [Methylobacterium segetis]|uniref:hypothetical protein n=1 Tax=Methylobacterium segetis TaxID=2488750 RepID=UPI00104E4611|nr:hypothetical protein [Methylobacterium segetis]